MTPTIRSATAEASSGRAGAVLTRRLPRGSGQPLSAQGAGRGSRSWGVVLLASLLVVGSGLAVAAWGLNAGDRVSVVAIGTNIAKGQEVSRSDLVSVSVAGLPDAVPIADVDQVVGEVAATDLLAGQVLTANLVTPSAVVPAEGEATVGLALDPNRVPAGLVPGDLVDVVAVPSADSGAVQPGTATPQVLATSAEVLVVDDAASVSGQQTITLVVAAAEASTVATYSAQGLVAVVEVALPADRSGSTTQGSQDATGDNP